MITVLDAWDDVGDETVWVIGMGPVGAVAALALAQEGVSVIVLESSETTSTDPQESRASTFHPPTLEMLDGLGIVEELHHTGLIAPTYQYRDRSSGVIADFDLRQSLASDTKFPYRLQSEQSNLVEIIRGRLAAMDNVRLVPGAELMSLTPDGDRVLLSISQGGTRREVSASWVIGADGSNSVVRQSLGIDFVGMTYPERFLVASTTTELADLIEGIAYVNYVSDPEEWLVLLRTPRHWRVLFPVHDTDDLDAIMEPASIEARLQSVVTNPAGFDVSHTTIYKVHQRVAESFGAGQVVLVGDAAHINNPLGGMGMNSGIHDSVAAVRAVVSGLAGDGAALGRYADNRRRIALDYVQEATHRNWQVMQERDPARREAHHTELRRTAEDPALARSYLLKASMLSSVRGG